MQNYWCENCNNRWQGDENDLTCPDCKGGEVRKTMSESEAKERGFKERL